MKPADYIESIPDGEFLHLCLPDFIARAKGDNAKLVSRRPRNMGGDVEENVTARLARAVRYADGLIVPGLTGGGFKGSVGTAADLAVGINSRGTNIDVIVNGAQDNVLNATPAIKPKMQQLLVDMFRESAKKVVDKHGLEDAADLITFFRNKKQAQGALDLNKTQMREFLKFSISDQNTYKNLTELKKVSVDHIKKVLPAMSISGISNYVIGSVLTFGMTHDEYMGKMKDLVMNDVGDKDLAKYKEHNHFLDAVKAVLDVKSVFDLRPDVLNRVLMSNCF